MQQASKSPFETLYFHITIRLVADLVAGLCSDFSAMWCKRSETQSIESGLSKTYYY